MSKGGAHARRAENNRIYAHPLPLTFPQPQKTTSTLGLNLRILSTLLLPPSQPSNPHCTGTFDPLTRSVHIPTSSPDALLLWHRGFFGKGSLSRSEPSHLSRQQNARALRLQGKLTSEEVTALRRADRKKFKEERAKAIAAVAEEAEAIFESEGIAVVPALSGPAIPSAATWRAVTGGPVFPKPVEPVEPVPKAEGESDSDSDSDASDSDEEEELKDVEHLQLTLQEAWFLTWTLRCLTILDPTTQKPMSIQETWLAFQSAELAFSLSLPYHALLSSPSHTTQLAFDNPFLIQYVAYHHYRSLGWVVKGGIKFCVDYLLYKRGPVFSHAEFALVLVPVYEDSQDRDESPFAQDVTDQPFSWSWLSTLNRVNTQVQKTLVLVYVTIPSRKRVNLDVLKTPQALEYYSVREVIVRRFVPARMRE